MFWKAVRWGGTAVVIMMVAVAMLSGPQTGGQTGNRSSGEQGLRIR